MRTLSCKIAAFAAFVFCALSCLAQTTFSGNIQGVISDPTGASVPGATVHLRNIDTGVETVTKTSDTGNYRFSSLPPGRYMVRVDASGFRRAEENISLETGETQGINIRLELGTSSESVTVLAEAPPIGH